MITSIFLSAGQLVVIALKQCFLYTENLVMPSLRSLGVGLFQRERVVYDWWGIVKKSNIACVIIS